MFDFNYDSLLLPLGTASLALAMTMIMSWIRNRSGTAFIMWIVATICVTLTAVWNVVYEQTQIAAYLWLGAFFLIFTLSLNYGALSLFLTRRISYTEVLGLIVACTFPVSLALVMGFTGVIYWLSNIASAFLCLCAARKAWDYRRESPTIIGTMAGLFGALGASFFLCAIYGIINFTLYIEGTGFSSLAEVINVTLAVIVTTCVGCIVVIIHQERISSDYRADSLSDPLTGLHNRRSLRQKFQGKILVEGTALIIFDLDSFKSLNDSFGHAFGDNVLVSFANVITTLVRDEDFCVRLGGEEFGVILQNVRIEDAINVAERIRDKCAQQRHLAGGKIVSCTVSAGVSMSDYRTISIEQLLERADEALYVAKREGRNRVTAARPYAA